MSFYAAEPLILQRIRDQVPSLATVASASRLAGADDPAAFCVDPNDETQHGACFVIPMEGEVTGSGGEGVYVRFLQGWLLLFIEAHEQDPADEQTTASRAGAAMLQAVEALAGMELAPSFGGRLTFSGYGAPYYEAGYGEFPVYFRQANQILGVEA